MGDRATLKPELSNEFVQWVKKEILYFLLKRPHLVLLYNVAFLWQRAIGYPWPKKGWFPKNYLDTLDKELEHHILARIATLARLTQKIGSPNVVFTETFLSKVTDNQFCLGAGAFDDTFRAFIAEVFPFANEIPHFFDHLYEEFVRISKLPTDHWWHLEECDGKLTLCVNPERRRKRQNDHVVTFKKAKSV
ncbi:MAG: hypothetical protein A2408_02525 [Candidatus Yonathbacteria bacterium RIFOXYC1_FULL_52_10]|uniref:Uncharacterized protein n=1 Tax=Candidatus Yonathbacteria bacterium RIFOXYD1_FULL_52_36 TaxID=1802730 RepID=A0A1G2SL27_9BACT|nr:MAG: hypothetical protein A2408_02525 [Candidatus Yonathbacteria bacterium RIFOXYC1_FULL_52_10]OHA85724.1 MAG: hypothetical protein A2591_02105 [Candidatus Yonathbacteria bacterium RIFOXYD1_FULL_52_36]